MRRLVLLTALMGVGVAGSLARAASYADAPGPWTVGTLETTWQDPARSRDVSVLICYPRENSSLPAKRYPVIVFSHGLGATRESYEAYGTHWASYGYVVVFPQHQGSDSGVIGHGMMEMLMGKNDLQPFLDRVADVHFVIDQAERLNGGKLAGAEYLPLIGRLDMDKVGMAGHSFGAITTEAIVGEKFRPDIEGKMMDPRVKAGMVMSGNGSQERDQDKAFGSIKIPVFYLTGTDDKIGMIGVAERRVPFDHSTFPETFLLTFNGANHMTFVPRQRSRLMGEGERFQSFLRQSTTAFWDGYLKGDAAAKAWFTKELPNELGAVGKLETKQTLPESR